MLSSRFHGRFESILRAEWRAAKSPYINPITVHSD
jgi:hypothetical protein